MKELAKEKIKKERTVVNGNNYVKAVAPFVADVLTEFIEENAELATAIASCEKTLNECCSEITKDAEQYLSDLEVYKRAVKFYLPDADLKCEMRVVLPGGGKKFNLSLESFI